MEYYFYIILIFAIILKLTLYLCWYQVRRNAAAREVRIIMPDGSTRYAVVTDASGVSRTRASSEERQCLPHADALAPYDNQGMVERPIQPRFMGSPQGTFPAPPPYPIAPGSDNGDHWKLPKYEELDDAPPPYMPPSQADNQGEAPVQAPPVTNQMATTPNSAVPAIQTTTPQLYSLASAIPTIPAATGTMAPSYAISPTSSHTSAASALGRGHSPVVSPQTTTIMPEVGSNSTTSGAMPGAPE